MGTHRKWPGGYITTQKDGRDLYILQRMVMGVRYHFSTRTHSLRAAMAQLELFEKDPANYRPGGGDGDGIYLSTELIDAFHEYQTARGLTLEYVRDTKKWLLKWEPRLRYVDLRKATKARDLLPLLDKNSPGARRPLMAALKTFCTWLREERHALTSKEDPTVDLVLPSSVPEKYRRRKVVEVERIEACARHLSEPYRDCLQLLLATAWHVRELERFVRDPESKIGAGAGDVLAVLSVLHKGREVVHTPLTSQEALDCAVRLRARGEVPRKLNQHVKLACESAGVEPFTLGVMRHTVLTEAVKRGATPEQAAAFAGHKDSRTTKRFYLDLDIPTVSVPTVTLPSHQQLPTATPHTIHSKE